MKISYICPVCGKSLEKKENSFVCCNKHCFDISKQGYVNLLIRGGKKGHGDDKIMVNARNSFLGKGYYQHLKNTVCEEIEKHLKESACILDSGCGEGYYTKGIYDVSQKYGCEVFGIDLSKEALKFAAKSCPDISFAAASAYCLPFSDSCLDIVLCLFAPLAVSEFYRVLKNEGIFITAVPLENHLFELKKAVYDKPYKNRPENTDLNGFQLISRLECKKDIFMNCSQDVKNLFMMTPYYYKTSQKDQQKLDRIESLNVQTEFLVLAYRKVGK